MDFNKIKFNFFLSERELFKKCRRTPVGIRVGINHTLTVTWLDTIIFRIYCFVPENDYDNDIFLKLVIGNFLSFKYGLLCEFLAINIFYKKCHIDHIWI